MKRLTRILMAVIGILFVALIIYSCINTEKLFYWHYSIAENGEEWAVQIHDTVPDYDFAGASQWSSIKELRKELLSGVADKRLLAAIRSTNFRRDPISLPNLLSISDIQLPEDCDLVSVSCAEYGFFEDASIKTQTTQMYSDGHPHLYFSLLTKKHWSRDYRTLWESYRRTSDYTVSSQKIDYRDANETIYYSYGRKYRVVEYTLSDGAKNMHVQERHADAFRYSGSDYVEPAQITLFIFGEQDGFYFKVLCMHISDIPSEDWIMQLGIQKATGAERILPFVIPIIGSALIFTSVVLLIHFGISLIKHMRKKSF